MERKMGECDVRYEMEQNAYIKIVLHALKHYTCDVNSVLLGRLMPNSDSVVEICDAVPLFHSNIGLLLPLEIAFALIEEYCRDKGLTVVAYFHANERFDDFEVHGFATTVGDHILKHFSQAAILLMDNTKLEALSKGNDDGPVVQLYRRDENRRWRCGGSREVKVKQALANTLLMDYIGCKKWKDVVDFSDHLDDIQMDWLNPNLFT